MLFLRLLQSVSNPGLGKSGWEAGGQYIYILMFLIFSKCVCIYIYRNCSQRHVWHCYFWCSLAARGFLPPTYWYHMADESTSYSLPLCSRPKSTGLSQLGRRRSTKGGSQVISSAPEPFLFLLECGSLFPTRACVHTCFLRSVPMAELSQRSIYFAGFSLRSTTILWSVVVWTWRWLMWSPLLEITT